MTKPVVYNYKTAENKIAKLKKLVQLMAETIAKVSAERDKYKEYAYTLVDENLALRREVNELRSGGRIINEMDEKTEWIPITEREPDTADHVLVTIKWGPDDFEVSELDYGVAKSEIQHTDSSYFKDIMNNIVAWRYMPEPYREGK